MRQTVRYLRRGSVVSLEGIDPNLTLLDHLRIDCRATGTKEGCNEGDCGACTVVLARRRGDDLVYMPVNACILLAGQVDGAEVITVDDLADGGALHPVQQAMVDHHASQCGFCTPGIVMSLFALYQDGARPVERQAIVDQLAGNLCRCTGYRPIIDAAKAACAGRPADRFCAGREARLAALAEISDSEDVFLGTEARFFAAPASLESLIALYAAHPDARLVAGATDVGLWLTKKLDDIPKLIWLGRVAGLDAIVHGDGGLVIGATVTLDQAAPALGALDPDLGEVMRRFGSTQVRSSGTVGGNIANGSPIGDLAPCLIALDSTMTLRSLAGERRMPLADFFIGYGRQNRAAGEVLTAVTVPALVEGQHFRAFKVSKRFDEDISAVMGAFRIAVADGRITGARVAFGGMAATPKRAAATERCLLGARIDDPATWEGAIDMLGSDYQPLDDMRASAAYRLATARALLEKALFEIGAAPSTLTRIIGHREARP
ncbi:MAG: xanthine dehydrogenase small subunit [Proteobacteria bacterium]|nr:xanthine dehydrogenase small subunit [Pseudomonadota bacterium]